MHTPFLGSTIRHASVALMLVCAIPVALAGKPEWAGKHGQRDREEQREPSTGWSNPVAPGVTVDIHIGGYFGNEQRSRVQSYYREESRSGHCPPGLAKKNNGCLPPGQAKKWKVGNALPRDVVYVPLEPGVAIRLGTPPAGHKFVRVAADILLIAVGTGMVIDAIEDLGR